MNTSNITDEVRYRILTYVADHPEATQRELARDLGVSLGKANYCLHAFMEKGWVKVRNFTNSRKKSAYAYILTPNGLEEKVRVTYAFLRRKLAEYDALRQEIDRLTRETRAIDARAGALPPEIASDSEPAA